MRFSRRFLLSAMPALAIAPAAAWAADDTRAERSEADIMTIPGS